MLKIKVMNVASGKKQCPSFSQVKEVIESKRAVVEQSRSGSIKRIQQDIQRIVKRERDFSKHLLEELIPVKVSWNEEALNKLKEFVPIQVEYTQKEEKDEDVVEPEVMEGDNPLKPSA